MQIHPAVCVLIGARAVQLRHCPLDVCALARLRTMPCSPPTKRPPWSVKRRWLRWVLVSSPSHRRRPPPCHRHHAANSCRHHMIMHHAAGALPIQQHVHQCGQRAGARVRDGAEPSDVREGRGLGRRGGLERRGEERKGKVEMNRRGEQSKAEQGRAEQAEQSRAEQRRAEQGRAEEQRTEQIQSRAAQRRAEESRAEQSRAEQRRAEQSNAEQAEAAGTWVTRAPCAPMRPPGRRLRPKDARGCTAAVAATAH